MLLGGNWDNGANAGARCANLNNNPWNVNTNVGLRCVCDPSNFPDTAVYGLLCL